MTVPAATWFWIIGRWVAASRCPIIGMNASAGNSDTSTIPNTQISDEGGRPT